MRERITLAHGNGGRLTRQLIDGIFHPAFGEHLQTHVDAASMPDPPADEEWLMTTDSYTVDPIVFPGGNIGSLAVHGTVNDLAVAGATPRFMTLNVIMEEGLEIKLLREIVSSIGITARDCGVRILGGDTKVVSSGQGGGLYLVTTGIGHRKRCRQTMDVRNIHPGDRLLSSGSLGDHGAAILLARQQFGLSGALRSDATSVLPVSQRLMQYPTLRFMRDPTRGGLASVAHDIARGRSLRVCLWEHKIPINPAVQSICDILGFEPLHLASEGRVIAVLSAADADLALKDLRSIGYAQAEVIGEIVNSSEADVVLQTRLGGYRRLRELEDDPLPRIC